MNFTDEAVILEEVHDFSNTKSDFESNRILVQKKPEECLIEEIPRNNLDSTVLPGVTEKFNFGGTKYNIILPDDEEIKHFRFISNWERHVYTNLLSEY